MAMNDGVDDRRSARRAAIATSAIRLRRALSLTVRSQPGLAAHAAALSLAYRSGESPANPAGHIHDPASADAYAAARMPATFASIARALAETADRMPDFRPGSLLDVGAGTGAASWAATTIWPTLVDLSLVDREPAAIDLGRRLAAVSGSPVLAAAHWRRADFGVVPDLDLAASDIVTAAYVLNELPAPAVAAVVARLWAATRGLLIIVEPGSRAGFERIRAARDALIEAGGHVAAPCPGDAACPISGAAWCHFIARLDRSPLQRGAKAAERSWEDEPFSFVALSRVAAEPAPRVVLGRPRQRPGVIELRVCVDGRIDRRLWSRRHGRAYRTARDLAWGDVVPPGVLDVAD
ncbi:MAG: small ribosomal subunit Rsm22 family protein [Candidatus Limnocylindrales bacterium]